jgi:hypothetical protein
MMRKGKPLGLLNWKTRRFFLMSSVDRQTLDMIRDKTEYCRRQGE